MSKIEKLLERRLSRKDFRSSDNKHNWWTELEKEVKTLNENDTININENVSNGLTNCLSDV